MLWLAPFHLSRFLFLSAVLSSRSARLLPPHASITSFGTLFFLLFPPFFFRSIQICFWSGVDGSFSVSSQRDLFLFSPSFIAYTRSSAGPGSQFSVSFLFCRDLPCRQSCFLSKKPVHNPKRSAFPALGRVSGLFCHGPLLRRPGWLSWRPNLKTQRFEDHRTLRRC